MCGPESVLAIQGAGAGMSAIGAFNQAQGQKDAYNYQASIDEQNVLIAKEQASQALQVGQTEEQSANLKTAQTFGSQRAAMASNGIDISSSGSAIDVLSTTKYLGARDALTIHDNALRAAWGYNVQATTAQNSANFMKYAAKSISPAKSAFGSLLGGAGQVANKWYDLNKAGAFSNSSSSSDTGPGTGGLY